jgi:hypothetical protein
MIRINKLLSLTPPFVKPVDAELNVTAVHTNAVQAAGDSTSRVTSVSAEITPRLLPESDQRGHRS